jgi:F0F1-type ATP synthase assembly protein I
MKKLYFPLSILALTIAGVMLAIIVMEFENHKFDSTLIYWIFGLLGTLIAGVNLIKKHKSDSVNHSTD